MQIDILQNDVRRGYSVWETGVYLFLDYAPTDCPIGDRSDRYYDMDTTLIGRVDIPDLDYIYEGDAAIVAGTLYIARLSDDGAQLLLADQYCKRDEYDFAYPIQQVTR